MPRIHLNKTSLVLNSEKYFGVCIAYQISNLQRIRRSSSVVGGFPIVVVFSRTLYILTHFSLRLATPASEGSWEVCEKVSCYVENEASPPVNFVKQFFGVACVREQYFLCISRCKIVV